MNNKERARLLNRFTDLIGDDREPYIMTGRKFDKVYVDGSVRYFVARCDVKSAKDGDILGAKSKLSPNFRWFFGTLYTIDQWDWSDFHGKPVTDDSVTTIKGYKNYKHYIRKN